ncbi:hypothetical protein PVAND_015351 [Polypedilum vanderplanki]|uniref:Uncharacterized protein n=1 Tax=Polypedilum vanderplanki TaxID=319348 RepID=A0A9J6BBX0_POLVA|nr:hypothetical protein PVAND_015351 [Polypedilum vanderplanki]
MNCKLSTDSDILSSPNNNNNHKWPSSCTNLLQNSINCVTSINNNTLSSSNNNSLKASTHLTLNHNMQTHHHALTSALSSPFSSLLGASSGGYLLDPLGNLQKSAASNHLF